jgi:hypothetical protein
VPTGAAYAPAIQSLLESECLFELGPGQPNSAAGARLRGLSLDALFAPQSIRDRTAAETCRAGLWLYHDFLDESHALSQDIETPEGSYWHAVMHRREPDYGNAKYWFRRVGRHAIFAPLRQRASELALEAGTPSGSDFLLQQSAWDPYAFIDLCEQAATRRAACEPLCRQVQRAEWDLLFEHCYRRALGQ